MKRIMKRLSFFLVFVVSFLIIGNTNISALSQQTDYIDVHDFYRELKVGDLSFSNLKFEDYSTNSVLSFGLKGSVKNNSNSTIHYTSSVSYYDADYNLIAQSKQLSDAPIGEATFVQMSNLSILRSHTVNDIKYYTLTVEMGQTENENYVEGSLTPSENSNYRYLDYVIDKYDVNIVVNENNTLDIKETITAYFNTPKHGIFRTIPLKNTITRLDGTTSKNRTQITNLNVDHSYKTTRENGNYKIQIGDADRTLTGKETYVIHYTYNLGKDPVKNYDELYYNIIGNDWDTVIGNITFTVTMPKEFDASKLGFSSGRYGTTENSNVKYTVIGNKITGSYHGILEAEEALTIRCELEEGYFVGAGLTIHFMDYFLFILPIIFLGIAWLIWYIFGRDSQVVETVEFYPPNGFNSLDVGFLYKGKADHQDVTSLLIYLANKGYIKISEKERKTLFGKADDFTITQLKEYDGNNENERLFLIGLFTCGRASGENGMCEVTSSDLYDNFYITMNDILSNVNSKENKNEIFEKSASSKTIFIILMIIATYCCITIPPVIASGQSTEDLLFALLFPGIGFTVMFYLLFGGPQTVYINGKPNNSVFGVMLFVLIWGGMFGGMPFIAMVLPALLQDPIYIIGYIVGIICVLGMVICLKYLPKRTKYGNEILGQLKGFKNFLETAEKEKLEAMVMENPTYFYDILPFTYVLGVSDKWIKKFETISIQAPVWYDSPNAFDTHTFGHFMNHTMTSAQSVMSSHQTSSGDSGFGGGSSGGGFSGGGSGGGGGGSW